MAWVAILSGEGGRVVGSVDAFKSGRLDDMSGQRPRTWAPRRRSREAMQRRLHEVGLQLSMAWVAFLSCEGGKVVGSVDAFQCGRLDFMSGRRPRKRCDGRGLRAVYLRNVGCGWLGRAASWLVGEWWYVRAAAPEAVRWPWSASSFPAQRGLWGAGSCGIVARERAMVCRGGGPGRWSWLIAQGAVERWMSGWRL